GWNCEASGANQASQYGTQIEATVESILGLSEVAMSVLGELEGMVGTAEGALEVTQEGIDRAQLRHPTAGLAAAGDHTLVLGADDLDGAEAPQPVGDHGGRRCDRAGGEDRYLLGGERLLAQAHELCL